MGVPSILWFYPNLYRLHLLERLQCFCGTAEDVDDNDGMSDQCGILSTYLCAGDPTTACGGRDAINVYQRTEYAFVGCFQDDQKFRIMGPKGREPVMSAEVWWYGSIRRGGHW